MQAMWVLSSRHLNLTLFILFLKMRFRCSEGWCVSSNLYGAPSQRTLGFCSFFELFPEPYKMPMIMARVYRVHHTSSTWTVFNQGLEKKLQQSRSKSIPYCKSFVVRLIMKTITKIINGPSSENIQGEAKTSCKKHMFLQCRGQLSDQFAKVLNSKGVKPAWTLICYLGVHSPNPQTSNGS